MHNMRLNEKGDMETTFKLMDLNMFDLSAIFTQLSHAFGCFLQG